MENVLNTIEDITLMGPGPSCVDPSVLQAMAKSTLGHLDPAFIHIMDEVKGLMRGVLHTENQLTLPISGTGSAGMETCFVNLIEKGDSVLVLINGVFGMRMQDVATRLGAEVDTMEFEWGTPVIVEDVKKQLEKKDYDLVAVVHAETSTGVRNPVDEIGALLRDKKSLFLVDAVTSFGGIEIQMDKWGIDALYSGTQKCLSCPPGLAPASFSHRAVEKIKNRITKVPNWYLDLTMLMGYWDGASRAYHHTAPINMVYGLYQALYLFHQEGEQQVFKRHMDAHLLLLEGLKDLGIDMMVDETYRLPMLNSVLIPNGADDAGVRSALLKDHKIEIGAGLGPMAGKIWRIGLMGHTARTENIDRLISAMKAVL